ncbi:MAG: regulatory signaling modulator protein AmpE [Pseudomonadota bacterium]
MHLIALLLGLVLEYRLTRLFSLRELRWFDAYFDLALGVLSRCRGGVALVLAVPVVALPVVPVAWACHVLAQNWLFGAPYVGFSVLMLLIALGPRNLAEDVQDYATALRAGDAEQARRLGKGLVEHDIHRDAQGSDAEVPRRRLREAIFVQADNRLFGVIFWFIVCGPFGAAAAWAFRISDLLRRRAAFEADRRSAGGEASPAFLRAVRRLHGLLAWVPIRLLALALALAGSFDRALAALREHRRGEALPFYMANEALLARVGCGALGAEADDDEMDLAHSVESALALVDRALWVWLTAIALMTLAGSVR